MTANLAAARAAGSSPHSCPHSWREGPLKVAPAGSPGRGRGLFATDPIAADELIDRACSIPLASEQCDRLEEILPLGDFYFRHPEDPEQGLVLLGLVSLVNHSETPNADVCFAWREDLGWVADLVALRALAAGEEVTYRYRCGPWFELG